MKILIVEDEPRFSDIIEQGLQEQGILVDVARDGVTGLKSAQSNFYDAVILDVMLPKLNGFQVLEAMREAGCRAPVLMLTARSGLDDRVKGLDLGADDYLPKPFAFKELLARLRAITRRPQVEPATILKVADLELNLVRREVRRAGQRIDLTAGEFALLELLMRHRDEVVTKAMIMNQMWGSDDVHRGGSNVTEVYINYLRSKVDQPFPRPLIRTVRGFGYLLGERE
ncbi:MAG: response regulator transcription factor [Holophaga sp.]|jgi:two-component system copper resistance phosphate regulon response regulator CusR